MYLITPDFLSVFLPSTGYALFIHSINFLGTKTENNTNVSTNTTSVGPSNDTIRVQETTPRTPMMYFLSHRHQQYPILVISKLIDSKRGYRTNLGNQDIPHQRETNNSIADLWPELAERLAQWQHPFALRYILYLAVSLFFSQ